MKGWKWLFKKKTNDIAIIGLSCRFPGAKSIEQYWENLSTGKETITFFSQEELVKAGVPESVVKDPYYVKASPTLDHVELFDAKFFQYSPREAELLDPQQRLLLECAWETLEHAGCVPNTFPGTIGVFCGAGGVVSSYFVECLKAMPDIQGKTTSTVHLGNDKDFVSTRISYKLDLKGPSLDVQTACSTSLVSVHLACQSILQGECDMALAGGVSIRIPQRNGYKWEKGEIFSADGHCRPFDADAQGTLFGSGVGLVLLKRLDKAIQDGDYIYAIIKGSAINNDGGHKVSYLAASAAGQVDCMTKALKAARVDPATISFVEAHGTGTIMGDPVEVSALTQTFRKHTQKTQYCALGSVKSNVGHLDTAAGIASLIKAVLAIYHKKIPPTIHFKKANPKINFSTSPFYVNDQLIDWPVEQIPRRAAINSLGIGGTNAFMILEEAPAREKIKAKKPLYLLTFSAKTNTALDTKIQEFLTWLNDQKYKPSLEEISYTLNIGRGHFNKRYAIVVSSIDELKKILHEYLKGNNKSIESKQPAASQLTNSPFLKNAIDQVMQQLNPYSSEYRDKLTILAGLYIEGYTIDWLKIHKNEANKKIALPTYPFEREFYWISGNTVPAQNNKMAPSTTSLTKLLDSNEFYFTEHKINSIPVLPGVVHLELVREVSSLAIFDKNLIGLKNVVWTQLIQGEQSQQVTIQLRSEEGEDYFEISSSAGIHSQGKLIYSSTGFDKKTLHLDIASIKHRCDQIENRETVYKNFLNTGFEQRYQFQVIQELAYNEHEAIAHLVSPEKKYQAGLDVRLLDGAVQTALRLVQTASDDLHVPFSIGQIEFFDSTLPERCYAHAVMQSTSNDLKLFKFDVQICDEQGQVFIVFHDFSVKSLQSDIAKSDVEMYYYRPIWEKEPINPGIASIIKNESIVILDEWLEELIRKRYPSITVASNDLAASVIVYRTHIPDTETLTNSFIQKYIYVSYGTILKKCQSLIHEKNKKPIQIIHIIESKKILSSLLAQPLMGFAKTLALEYPQIKYRTIELNHLTEKSIDAILSELNTNDLAIRYQNNKRMVKRYQEVSLHENKKIKLRHQGVYLITGGMGGLGLKFASYLAKNYHAKLILIGRSSLGEKEKSWIERIKQLGGNGIYIPADVSNKEDLQHVMSKIRNQFKKLHGVLHCAGVKKDSFIMKKTPDESKTVFLPKINGSVNLSDVTSQEKLDFFILFSSVSAIFGNVGQVDYAYANGFMDAFARYRNALRKEKKCYGKSIAINWPVWSEGGMRIDKESEEWLRDHFGIVALSNEDGLAAFRVIQRAATSQLIVLKGYKNNLDTSIHSAPLIKKDHKEATLIPVNKTRLFEKISANVIQMLAHLLKIDIKHIHQDEELSNYGIDSVSLTTLANQLNRYYGLDLTPAVLFEYTTLTSFIHFLIEEYPENMEKKHGVDPSSVPAKKIVKSSQEMITKDKAISDPDIAIIGMSGRFPGSENLSLFWENLVAQKDLITEIPKTRWNWQEYYGDVKDNKTKIKWGSFIDDVECFDAGFFNITPREAELMDPQQRIFLQTVWAAIEEAGYHVDDLHRVKTGLFVGVFGTDYAEILQSANEIAALAPTGVFHSVLANRISYFLNLNGPSEAIDTACSSSLVAIHQAINSIRNGDCDIAIAGGVNLILTPRLHIEFNQAGMLSEDGRCKTFDATANGYGRGEGVAAILLKPLDKAIQDGDIIHGVIKGSTINHGGHVNSLTVPNPNAQAELVTLACERAKIAVDTISYIETHGTGTELGDPIEINGLKKAFQTLAKQQFKDDLPNYYCGLGTVKTNIGHLESAAGIAGVVKVLLAMKYKKLPGTVHFKTLNPQIKIQNSPFYIVDKTKNWERLIDAQGHELPRRAGVSSFGFGGANAHLIMEEYITEATPAIPVKPYYLVTLSAKTMNSLKQHIVRLIDWIDKNPNTSIESISYTLNAKRVQFEKRCFFIVKNANELYQYLVQMNQGVQSDNYYRKGDVFDKYQLEPAVKKEISNWLNDLSGLTNHLSIYREKLTKIGELYLKGYDIDWQLLHEKESKKKISLPTYAFEKKRHWINVQQDLKQISHALHPLLDSKESSNLFKKVLTADQFYLKDHHLYDQVVLPGSAYIEMMYAAGSLSDQRNVISIYDVLWVRPITQEQLSKPLYIEIQPVNSLVTCRIYGYDHDEKIIFSEGKLEYEKNTLNQQKLEISSIYKRCTNSIPKEKIYEQFRKVGFYYGDSFQSIKNLYYNKDEVVAELILPDVIDNMINQFVLHPSLLDAAIGSALFIDNEISSLRIPFSLDRLTVIHPIPRSCFVYAKYSESDDNVMKKCDIWICDINGEVVVTLQGYAGREYKKAINKIDNVLFYQKEWVLAEAPESLLPLSNLIVFYNEDIDKQKLSLYPENTVLVNLDKENHLNSLPDYTSSISHVIILCNQNLDSVFLLFKALSEKINSETKVRCVYGFNNSNPYEQPMHEAAIGFAHSLKLILPNWDIVTVQADDTDFEQHLLNELCNSKMVNGAEIRYQHNERYVKQAKKIDFSPESESIIRQKGIYLITGGLGGLGFKLAGYLLQNYQAKLILVGRRSLNQDLENRLAELKILGGEIVYVQGDVSKLNDMNHVMDVIRSQFGHLNGVVHAAGVIKLESFAEATLTDFQETLLPKINGIYNLDHVTQQEPLDFFVAFSSIASEIGNYDSGSYGAANRYMDSYCELREQLRLQGKRQGKSLAIDWPYWTDSGMKLSKEQLSIYQGYLGMKTLDTDVGLRVFDILLTFPLSHIIVVSGDPARIESVLGIQHKTIKKVLTPVITNTDSSNIHVDTEHYLQNIFAKITKIPIEEIDSSKPLEEYGINSIMILNFNRELNVDFHNLRNTLLFEYRTLSSLAEYLIKEQHAQLNQILYKDRIEYKINSDKEKTAETEIIKVSKENVDAEEGIAIVGISGSYPDADTLEQFWENLKSGKDSIREVPLERWDYKPYYDPEKGKLGKSYSKWGSFIRDADKFDAEFFKISPREAEQLDPQERLMMQTAWSAIEDAGYNPYVLHDLMNGNVGVFVGVMWNEYQLLKDKIEEGLYGNSNNGSLANRISYFFDYHGPSLVIDTMCSSSLVAIHMACESILRKECRCAIAGGVNLSLHPSKYVNMSQMSLLSSQGHCKSFGEGGDGYVPGEGVGAVLLKPLSQALKDGDTIYAVIKGSSMNHGGKTHGFTVPNPDAQSDLIKTALTNASITPESISYVEAHGTGTALGDPIEITGLCKAYGDKVGKQVCSIGSVKSNIGHLEGAAGIVALTKVVLQFKHKQLVPSIHSEILNPHINFLDTPFYVQQTVSDWKPINGYPRRAGISSFGAGGTNAHLILEEPPISREVNSSVSKPFHIVTLSAKNETSLRQQISNLYRWLEKNLQEADFNKITLGNISFTLNTGRVHFEKRIAMIAESLSELKKLLHENKNVSYVDQKEIVSQEEINQILHDLAESNLSPEVYRQKLENLAKYYVNGNTIQWSHLYKDGSYIKLSLPTYAFVKERYWYGEYQSTKGEHKAIQKQQPLDIPVNKVTLKMLENPNVQGDNIEKNKKINLVETANKKTPEQIKPIIQTVTHLETSNVKDSIRSLFSDVLYMPIENLSTTKNFSDLGVDSVLAVELINKINKKFNLELTATLLYDYPTISLLSDYIANLTVIDQAQEQTMTVTPPAISHESPQEQNIATKEALATQPVDIAIIGIACQFPGAKNVDEFWDTISQGKSSVTEIPRSRWLIEQFYDPDNKKPNKTYSKWGAFLEGVDQFDSLFFSISPSEADWIDPQQRLLLQTAIAAIEDAGYSDQSLSNTLCGAYIGVMNNDYSELIATESTVKNAQQMIGNSNAILASRIAYFLNLKGPALTVDTACSSSLVALHLASQALQNNEVNMMLVGGVTLYLTATPYIGMSKAEMLSPEGKCKTFDETADGFVPGEGVGVVLLKKLDAAIKDHDHIYAIIKGSAINQDGATNGITAPSALSQKDLEMAVYSRYQINPESITYVEAHGTGTKLGDPIEVQALTEAFRTYTNKTQYCAIGSIKTNIGHTSAASGMASLIKVILCLQNNQLIPSLNFKNENPYLNLKNSPFYVNTELKAWNAAQPKRAAISSFGFSGTNAHVVVEEGDKVKQPTSQSKPAYLITLSAKSKYSLKQRILDLEKWLSESDDSLENISFTLNMGRSHYDKRCALVVKSIEELRAMLKECKQSKKIKNVIFSSEKSEDGIDELIYSKASQQLISELEEPTSQEKYIENIYILARLYTKGYNLDWDMLHRDETRQRISLPTYPFQKKRHWIKTNKTNVVSDLYDNISSESNSKININKKLPYLTFGTFDKVMPGFSWSDTFVSGKNNDILLQAQNTLRDVLFRHVDFENCHTILDIGCGYGEDVVSLGMQYPHLKLCGNTISPKQVDLAMQRINQAGLSDRVMICLSDSSIEPFREYYDVIFGFEVAHHIKNKASLFKNIANHLTEKGQLILADFVSHAEFAIEHEKTNSYFITLPEWITVLSDNSLQIIECVDASIEIANFLNDPHFDANFARLSNSAVREAFLSYHQLEKLLQQKIASYMLFTVVKNPTLSNQEIRHINDEMLKNAIPYGIISHIEDWFYKTELVIPNKKIRRVEASYLIIANEDNMSLANSLKNEFSADIINISAASKLEWIEILKQHNVNNIIYIQPISSTIANVFSNYSEQCANFIYFAQALIEITLPTPPKIWFLVKGNSAPVDAMTKTWMLEEPLFSCTTIMLSPDVQNNEASQFITEAIFSCSDEKQVVLKKEGVQLMELQRIPIRTSELLKQHHLKFHSHATCLISGGLGGLGMKLVKWYAAHGIKHFLLLGRHKPTPISQHIIDQLTEEGINIQTALVDVANEKQLNLAIEKAKKTMPPIQYVIHAAGVTYDAAIANQDNDSIENVLLPKVKGAWNLHKMTLDLKIESFVLFSSAAAMMGSAGQINYAAANGYLNSLAEYRQKLGLPCVSINWGLWSTVGMASHLDNKNHLNFIKNGIYDISVLQGLSALKIALLINEHVIMIAPIDWKRYQALSLKSISHEIEHVDVNHLLQKIRTYVSETTDIAISEIDDHETFSEMGIDSVLGINLRNRIQTELGSDYKVSSTVILDHPTITKLVNYLENNKITKEQNNTTSSLAKVIQLKTDTHLLSFGQQRIYFAYKLEPELPGYNCSISLALKGSLNEAILKQSCENLMRRHEILRTVIQSQSGRTICRILSDKKIDFDYKVISTSTDKMNQLIMDLTKELYKLETGPLIRFVLLKLSEQHHVLIIAFHHIIMDGVSLHILTRELAAMYNAYSAERDIVLPPVNQYSSFSQWQHNWLTTRDAQQKLQYWKTQLTPIPPSLNLITDKLRKSIAQFTMKSYVFSLSNVMANKILEFSKNNQILLSSSFLAAYEILLSHYAHQARFAIGVLAAGRTQPEFENTVGYFLNVLPIIADLKENISFIDLVKHVDVTQKDAFTHQEIPFEVILSELKLHREPGVNPIFQVSFVYQNFLMDDILDFMNLNASYYDANGGVTNEDLLLEVRPKAGHFDVILKYNTNLFEESSIAAMAETYLRVLDLSLDKAEMPITLDNNQVIIASSFTAEPVDTTLSYWLKKLNSTLTVSFAPYNQVLQELLNSNSKFTRNASGINVILLRIEDLQTHSFSSSALKQSVEEFLNILKQFINQTHIPLVISICPPSPQFLEKFMEKSQYDLIENYMLIELQKETGIVVISQKELANYFKDEYYDPISDASGHVPYTAGFYTSLGTLLARKLYALLARPFKVIVLDADNTLWQGVLGEEGVEGVQVTPPFYALQQFIVNQNEAGMLICLCSKNEESDVLQFFEKHPDNPLQKKHFTALKINWNAKSKNIKKLAMDLNLNLDSFVFIDDNLTECAEVAANCRDVLTLQLPENLNDIPHFLEHIWVFDHLHISDTDKTRSQLYQQNIKRELSRKKSISFADFINNLHLEISLLKLTPDTCQRVAQLTQRTNQFNMTTIRMSESEVKSYLNDRCLIVKVKDRFGDYGLVGAIFYKKIGQVLDIENFLLSCRVLGKGIEYKIIAELGRIAQSQGCSVIVLHFTPSARNLPAKLFLDALPLQKENYQWILPVSAAVTVKFNNEPVAINDNETTTTPVRESVLMPCMRSELAQEIADTMTNASIINEQIHTQLIRIRETSAEWIEPESELDKKIADLFCQILHVDKISLEDNFFDMGATSLTMVQIQSELYSQFQIEIPLIELFHYPTITALTHYLLKQSSKHLITDEQRAELELQSRKKHRINELKQNGGGYGEV